jgi:hypothetical protein
MLPFCPRNCQETSRRSEPSIRDSDSRSFNFVDSESRQFSRLPEMMIIC